MLDDLLGQILSVVRRSVSGRTSSALRSRFDTSDIVQEAAIQIWSDFQRNGTEGMVVTNAWLRTIGRGHASKMKKFHEADRRNTGREQDFGLSAADSPTPLEAIENNELVLRLLGALGQASSDQRRIMHLRFVKQASFNAIAKEMELPVHTVRRQYQSAIKQLHRLVDPPSHS